MQSICLVYHEEKTLDALSRAELDALVGECGAWVEALEKGGQRGQMRQNGGNRR